MSDRRAGGFGWAWRAVATLAVLSLVLPWLGSRFWLAELSTHFVPHYAAAALIVAIVLGLRNRPFASLAALAVCAVQVARLLPLWAQPDLPVTPGPAERLTISQLNVNFNNADIDRIVQWFETQDSDVAVLVEVTPEWSEAMTSLRARYPHSLVRIPPDGSGVAVFAKQASPLFRVEPLGDAWCPAVVLNVPQPTGPSVLALFATHLRSPMTPGDAAARNRQLSVLARRVEAEPALNKVVVGDLNITRWSPLFGHLTGPTGIRDGQEGFGLGGSWPSVLGQWMGIPIDQTLVSSRVRVVRRVVGPDLGSDHLPVTTTIEFSPGVGLGADDRDFSA
ncbi:MAG: endonuclease/exonuclease/phosphatase family protein [Nitrospirota bacterium]